MGPDLFADVLWPVWVAVVIVVLLAARLAARGSGARDPRRMFSTAERTVGFARAGNQCEFARWVFFRCTRTATHGDHFIPWSKGGATSMRNFVAACPTCNTTKGAVMPSRAARSLMAGRRRRYFPVGVPREAGEWCGAVR